MIEVVAIDGGITKYDGQSSYMLDEQGFLVIYGEADDRGRTIRVAIHAAGTWAIARKVTA